MKNNEEFPISFILYKARNDGNGAASQWSISSKKESVFLEMANQEGKDEKNNARFAWDKKICFKLGEPDIGEILSVLAGLQQAVGPFDSSTEKHKGLFHTNPNGNAVLYFGKDKYGKFNIYLSVKRDGEQSVVRHSMTNGESCVLGTLLRRAIEVMYRWN